MRSTGTPGPREEVHAPIIDLNDNIELKEVCDESSRLKHPGDFPECGFDGKLCEVMKT